WCGCWFILWGCFLCFWGFLWVLVLFWCGGFVLLFVLLVFVGVWGFGGGLGGCWFVGWGCVGWFGGVFGCGGCCCVCGGWWGGCGGGWWLWGGLLVCGVA
ncbi:hypothetical protein RA276_28580, partial [Pseudomonas syringae pv. tagetis]|uniref:hypothetical protein n=1 Tax=Pseudomonas syringae group genomosp. 7 TaxID=251699 RepID=UPI0037706641